MGAMRGWCLEWGEYKLNASKILDLFEKVERILDAHGIGVSCKDVLILTL
jgi:hypothetical protein